MRGLLYACEWLEATMGGISDVVSRTRAIWIPEEHLLLQWVIPAGVVQASRPDSFPPPESEARVAFLGFKNVPHKVIRQSRLYFKSMEHVHAQEAVIQLATQRNTAIARGAESKLQAKMDEAGLRR